jgi:phosphate:Na+ symporter
MSIAQEILDSKQAFNRHADRIRLHLARKLAGGQHATLQAYRLGLDQVENLKRLHSLTRRIARVLLDAEGTLETRNSFDTLAGTPPSVEQVAPDGE